MHITLPGMVLFALSIWWAFKPVRLLQLALISAIFEASAAAVFGSFGLQPAMVPGLLFVFFVAMQYGLGVHYPGEKTVFRTISPLLCLLAYAALSIWLFTFAFGGDVLVWPQRPDPGMTPGFVLLEFSSGNITQILYLTVNTALAVTVAVFLTRSSINFTSIIRAYLASGYMVVVLVFWQLGNRVAGIPYPDDILYSNPGWAIVDQEMSNIPRLQGPFAEPSALAVYNTGLIFCSLWLTLRGYRTMRPDLLLALAIVSMMLSTSTTGIVTTVVGVPLVMAIASVSGGSRAIRRIFRTLGYFLFGGLLLLGPIFWLKPELIDAVNIVVEMTLSKGESHSYEDRTGIDAAALNALLETYGLGVGWGSFRSMSLIPGILANIGLFGLGLVLWLAWRVFRLGVRARASSSGHEGEILVDGMSAALCGQLAAAVVSSPVITSLAFYLQLGCVVGVLSRMTIEPPREYRRPRQRYVMPPL